MVLHGFCIPTAGPATVPTGEACSTTHIQWSHGAFPSRPACPCPHPRARPGFASAPPQSQTTLRIVKRTSKDCFELCFHGVFLTPQNKRGHYTPLRMHQEDSPVCPCCASTDLAWGCHMSPKGCLSRARVPPPPRAHTNHFGPPKLAHDRFKAF